MRTLRSFIWVPTLAAVLLTAIAMAGTTGKISGVVTDKANGQPIPGAAVSIVGTTWGALSDEQGRYVILNVPVGTYAVKAALVGYTAIEVTGISVHVDLTTVQDFSVSSEAVEMGTVSVTAERPLVLHDQTSSLRIVTEDQIQNLPAQNYQDVVAGSAGVRAYADNGGNRQRGLRENSSTSTLNVRGGRRSEVAYFVDGFSQQDPVTGLSTTQISQNAIQEIAVTTGGFNAEYGWISSGAINVTTKEGWDRYSGVLDLSTDNLVSKSYDYNNYNLNLSGPLLPNSNSGSFFVSGERRWQGDRSPRSRVREVLGEDRLINNSLAGWSWQGKVSVNLTQDIKWRTGILGSFDDWREYTHEYLFNREHNPRYEDKNNSVFTQIVHSVNPKTFYTLSANYFTTERKRGDGKYFDDILAYARPVSNPTYFTGDLFWKYDDMYPQRFDSTWEADGGDSVLTVDTVQTTPDDPRAVFIHTPTVDTLVRAIIDSTTSPTVTPYPDAPDIGLDPFVAIDTTFVDDTVVTRVDTTWGRGFMAAARGDESHVWEDYLHRQSSYYGFDLDLTSQVHPSHEVKAGLEYQRHTLRFYQNVNPHLIHGYFEPSLVDGEVVLVNDGFKDVNNYGYDLFDRKSDTLSEGEAARHPVTFAGYLQDKFEWEGLVVNAGLRFDYFNANTDRLKDPTAPMAFGIEGELDPDDFTSTKAETRLSPRLGVGFPTSDRANFHLSFGRFFQRPDLENLYMGRQYMRHMIENTPYFNLVANPNLAPERTTAYEVGYTQQMGDYTRLDITAFHKDVENLTVAYQQNATNLGSRTSFGTFRNADYGTVRGFEMGIAMRRNHGIQLDGSYTLQYAKGTGSFPQTQYNVVWQNQNSPRHSSPLDYDQRHKISGNIDIRAGSHEGPEFGDIFPLENAGVNVAISAGSGSPYTHVLVWNEVSTAAGAPDPDSPINSVARPWNYRIDLRANKSVHISGLEWDFYVWVLNLLDRENVVDVYESTGSPTSTGWLNTEDGQKFIESNSEPTERSGLVGEELYQLKERNPFNYDTPRQVRFGARVSF